MFNINVETLPSSIYKVEKISRKNRKKVKKREFKIENEGFLQYNK